MNSFAFHELPVKLALPRTGTWLTSVRHHATYHIDARWLNVCGTTLRPHRISVFCHLASSSVALNHDGLSPSFICVALLGFKHHLAHVAEHATSIAMFYWQGQRDTNCTTICVQQHNRAGCDPLLLFLKCHLGEIWWTNDSIRHAADRRTFPILLISMWFVGSAGFETNVASAPLRFPTHKDWFPSLQNEMNMLNL